MKLLTDDEERIVHLLAEAWDAFSHLPKLHPDNAREFCNAIHACQEKIMMRPMLREFNKRYPVTPYLTVIK